MLRVAQCSMHFFVVAATENSLIEHEVQRPDRLQHGHFALCVCDLF